jgi:hypothetical protein
VPSLVVQAESPVDVRMNDILLPVAGHEDISGLLNAVCMLAKQFGSKVHVFQVMRPGEQPSDKLLANKLAMLERLREEGIPLAEDNMPSTVFSMGFAEQTIRYAKEIGAGAIAIMAQASSEYSYMADAEKERLLVNDARVPVLCAL